MRLRSRVHLAALSLLALGAAACTDESPLLTGDPFFPDGRPATVETIIPAGGFFQFRGAFTGYTNASAVSYAVVANSFDGGVTARTLMRFVDPLPKEIDYAQDGVAKRDSLYTVVSLDLVMSVDSTASVQAPVTLTAHRLTQSWQDSVVTWTVRERDSTGVVHSWAQPGGAFNPTAAGSGSYIPADSASTVTLGLSATEGTAMRDPNYPGLLVQSTQPNTRLELTGAELRIRVRPSNAVRDTTIQLTATAGSGNVGFIFNPDPPQPAGVLQAGTVLSARSLFSVQIPDSVTVCTPACGRRAVRDLALNHASLLLRPLPVGGGYRLLDSAAITLRTVAEPGLGRLAPLGDQVVASFGAGGRPSFAVGVVAPGDTLVEVPFTLHAARLISGDSTAQSEFAMLASTYDEFGQAPFSLMLFDAAPRLRIVFTVPERPRLP